MKAALPRSCARPRRSPPTSRSRSSSPAARRRCTTTARSRRAGSRTPRPTASTTRGRTRPRARPTWATSPGRARRSTRSSRSCDEPTPGHSIEFRDAAARPRADETMLLAATLVAQTALDLLARPGARRRRPGASSAARPMAARDRRPRALRTGAGTMPPGAPRWTADPNRRRPTRRRRPPGPRPATDAPPPEDHVAERPDAPGRRRLRRAQRLGPRVRDVRRLRPADLRRPADVHEAAVGARTRPSSAPAGVDVAIVGAPFDDAVSHRPGARFGPAGDPRGAVHVGLDPLAPAGRRAVRDPRPSSTPATRTSSRPGSSAPTR